MRSATQQLRFVAAALFAVLSLGATGALADSHEEPAPASEAEPAAEAAAAAPAEPAAAPKPEDDSADEDSDPELCPEDHACVEAAGFAVWPRARLRAAYEYIQPDEQVLVVGQNDGFFLDQVRLGLAGTWENRFHLVLIVELASVLPGGKANDPVQPVVTAARDAFLAWTPFEYLHLSIGQQYMPFDREGMTSRAELAFTGRSVATGGVRAGRGYEVVGLAPDRQIGLVIGAAAAPLGPMTLDYRLAISNGNDSNHLGNDNKTPAAFARVGAGLKGWVNAGVAASWNPRTTGEIPNLYSETHLGLAGDVHFDVFGVDVLAQGQFRRINYDTAFEDAADPGAADHSVGLTTWLVLDDPFGLPLFGFQPGYRFSYFDPYFSDPDDTLIEHTFGLRYDPPTPVPVAFLLDATLIFEAAELAAERDSARYLDNHRVVALVQFDL